MPTSLKRKIRKKAIDLRLHPLRPVWLVVLAQLRTGDRLWLAFPPIEFRWGIIASYHDRMGHAGVTQTLTVLHQHYYYLHLHLHLLPLAWHQSRRRCLCRTAPCLPSQALGVATC